MKKTGLKYYKLKVINTFFDIDFGEKRLINQEFETTEKRAKEILAFEDYKLVEILSINNGKK